ncbi:phosphohydrolase [Agromyces protaetiae]|uniref:Phosphohydrolase n=1 Tax=Agromyces protaetiae TaxID=2509455 RepID=A0A4P6FIA0_9MICO|nr:phosphohydrolase [Agromyces protaetiae]
MGLAQGIAFVAHRGQRDKVGGDYIDHPARVAERFDAETEPVEAAVAWLHDVVEDTELDAEDLLLAGVAPAIVDAVVLLTRTDDVSAADYYARIREHEVARRVKLADIADNTAPWRARRLDPETRERLAEKYAKAREALGEA